MKKSEISVPNNVGNYSFKQVIFKKTITFIITFQSVKLDLSTIVQLMEGYMNNNKKKILKIGLYVLLVCIIIYISKWIKVILVDPQSKHEGSEITNEEMLEDFEYLYKIISENYPYLDVCQRQQNFNWAGNRQHFLSKVQEYSTVEEFRLFLFDVLGKLGNNHTKLLSNDDVEYLIRGYEEALKDSPNAWQNIILEKLDNPIVHQRYNLGDRVASGDTIDIVMSRSVICRDLIKGELGYIYIPVMKQKSHRDNDEAIITRYLKSVKDYKSLIIDIRYNPGGDSSYWQEFLVPKIANRPFSSSTFNFYRDGSVAISYIDYQLRNSNDSVERISSVSNISHYNLEKLSIEVMEKFTYFEKIDTIIKPSDDSIEFSGNVYLLVNDIVYSSSEALAIFSKQSGFATLIGTMTGGDGIGSDPWIDVLPNSGFAFSFPKSLGVDAEGVINEEYKTTPHFLIESMPNWNNLIEDPYVQKVIELEGLK